MHDYKVGDKVVIIEPVFKKGYDKVGEIFEIGKIEDDFIYRVGETDLFTHKSCILPLSTIEQFREKYGKKGSVMEKLDPLLKAELVDEIKSAMGGMPFVSEKESVGGRLYYLKLHIHKNMEQGLCIPTEWVTEYNKHIEWLKNK